MRVLIACGVLLAFVAFVNANYYCQDNRLDCYYLKDIYCPLKAYEDFMKFWCAKTCGFCGATTNPPTIPPRPTLPPTMGPERTHPPLGTCGNQLIPNARVIAGETAKPGSWPWQVLLINNGQAMCGGTIVSPRWIVTAAHCVSGKEGSARSFQVRVGEHDRNRKEGTEVDMAVSRIISHPQWNSRTMNNDIAMIQLAQPIKFTEYVQPACLPDNDVKQGTECYITGWGKTSHPGSMTTILQQAILPVAHNSECERLNRNTIPIPITPAMICGGHGSTSRRQSGCHGDSGGPYVCKVGSKWELHGAVSHGSPECVASKTYTVFARVTYFKGWISTHMATYGV